MAAGRPRTFDADAALESAMQVFWRKGYEGASLADLTSAMGINPPSLYAAFGSKEALFRQTLDRYDSGPGSYTPKALMAPTAREVAEQLLAGAVALHGNLRNPKGCLGVQGALACGDGADALKKEQSRRRIFAEQLVCKRFQRAKAEGDLPKNSDPADLARYLRAVICGMAVQSADGATRRELQKTAEMAMLVWPA
jgi:AcrR family transcriptional regulator